jgi:hypothetical protein
VGDSMVRRQTKYRVVNGVIVLPSE